jgi:hypothetical protein
MMVTKRNMIEPLSSARIQHQTTNPYQIESESVDCGELFKSTTKMVAFGWRLRAKYP